VSSLLDRLTKLEKLYPAKAYDQAQHTRRFVPDAALIKDTIEASITVGLYPLLSEEQVNKLVKEIGESHAR